MHFTLSALAAFSMSFLAYMPDILSRTSSSAANATSCSPTDAPQPLSLSPAGIMNDHGDALCELSSSNDRLVVQEDSLDESFAVLPRPAIHPAAFFDNTTSNATDPEEHTLMDRTKDALSLNSTVSAPIHTGSLPVPDGCLGATFEPAFTSTSHVEGLQSHLLGSSETSTTQAAQLSTPDLLSPSPSGCTFAMCDTRTADVKRIQSDVASGSTPKASKPERVLLSSSVLPSPDQCFGALCHTQITEIQHLQSNPGTAPKANIPEEVLLSSSDVPSPSSCFGSMCGIQVSQVEGVQHYLASTPEARIPDQVLLASSPLPSPAGGCQVGRMCETS